MRHDQALTLLGTLRTVTNERGKLKGDRWSIALQVTHAIRRLNPIAEAVEEVRKALVERYARKDEDGNTVLDKSGVPQFADQRAFEDAWQSVLMSEVEGLVPLPVLNLDRLLASYELNPNDLVVLLDGGMVALPEDAEPSGE